MSIRTASHAFEAKDQVSASLAMWPEFDEEILGGNYQGHYGHLKERTIVSVVPGMGNHPLLKDVSPEEFASDNWLYKNSPLRSEEAQVLLVGAIPGQPSEPVLWINNNKYGKAIYTSLGHWSDWKIVSFKNAMINSVDHLLNQESNK